MGAPTSSVFSEIYLEFLEHTQLHNISIRHHILGYFRYVDDILVIYDASTTNIQTVLDQFNDASQPQRTGKLWRRVESYHAYVPSSNRTLGNGRGNLLVTD
jgi:hypothetical protein